MFGHLNTAYLWCVVSVRPPRVHCIGSAERDHLPRQRRCGTTARAARRRRLRRESAWLSRTRDRAAFPDDCFARQSARWSRWPLGDSKQSSQLKRKQAAARRTAPRRAQIEPASRTDPARIAPDRASIAHRSWPASQRADRAPGRAQLARRRRTAQPAGVTRPLS